MALIDEKNTFGQAPTEDKKLAEEINIWQKELTGYLKKNPGIEYTRVDEEFIKPLIDETIDNTNKRLGKITDKNIFENERKIANQRVETFYKSLAETAYEQTSLYGLIKQRSAANTELNDAGWYIQNYDNAVYLNPANKNPERLERSKQTYAAAEKNTQAYNAAINRELHKEIENLRGVITPVKEQLSKEWAGYNEELRRSGFSYEKTMETMDKRMELEQRHKAMKIAEKYLEQIEQTGEISPDKLKAFFQGFSHTDWADFATLGIKNLSKDIDLISIARKSDGGKALSREESLALDLYTKFQTIASGKETPWTYNASQGLIQSIPFMIDIALTGGLRTGITKAAGKISGHITNKLAKWTINTLGKGAGMAASAYATPIAYQNVAARELGSYEISKDAEGNTTARRYENAPSTFGNLVLGGVEGAISVGIEQMSLPLSKYGSTVINKYPKSNTAKVFGALLGAGAVREGNTFITQIIQNIRRKMSFGGFTTELGEEYGEKIANMLFLPDSPERQQFIAEENRRRAELEMPPLSWKDEFTWEEFLTTATSVGIMSGMFGMGRVYDRFHKRATYRPDDATSQLNEAFRKGMEAKLEEAGKRLSGGLRQELDNIMNIDDPQQRAGALQSLMNSAKDENGKPIPPNPQETKAIFEYIASRAAYDMGASFNEAAVQEQAAQYADFAGNAAAHSSGAVIAAADAEGSQYFVKDGDPNNPDGTIIVVNAQTGESKQTSPQGLQFQTMPLEEYRQGLVDQFMQQARPQEAAPSYKNGDKVIVDGIEYTLAEPYDEPGSWLAKAGDGIVYKIFEKDFRTEPLKPSEDFEPGDDVTINGTEYTVQGRDENGNIVLSFENGEGMPEMVAMPEAEFNAAVAAQQPAAAGQPLTEPQAAQLISAMEQNAAEAPVLELTPENWEAEFGEHGKVQTPIGEVKMGENQYYKIIKSGRQAEFGMIKPTLTSPDIIIEDQSEAIEGQTTERPSSYLFIKTFNINGEKTKFFTSVTISKEGLEVVVSNHILKPKQVNAALTAGKLQYQRSDMASRPNASDPASLEQLSEAVANVGTSTDKSTNISANKQENGVEKIIAEAPKQKNGEIDYDALLEQNPEAFVALYESEAGVEETKAELASVSENLAKKIQAEQKKLEAATSINKKQEARKAIAEFSARKQTLDALVADRYSAAAQVVPNDAGQPLTEPQAAQLISAMEQNATEAPVLELTPENWYAEFGEDGKVETPIGEVKMGENQLAKLILNKRTTEFGMIKPTLTNPDIILEVPSEAKEGQGTERPSSYLFVKTFIRNGEKIRHFETVTISKDGREVVISSHIIKPQQLNERLLKGKVLWSRYELFGSDTSGENQGLDEHAAQNPNSNAHISNPQSTFTNGFANKSERYSLENPEGLPDIVPTQANHTSKSTNISANNQENGIEKIIAEAPKQKNGEIDYDALLEQNPEAFVALYENAAGVEETKAELASVSENLAKKIQAEQKKLEAATSINKKQEARKAIAEFSARKQTLDALVADRYSAAAVETNGSASPGSASPTPQQSQQSQASQQPATAGQPLTEPQANQLISAMEQNAAEAPVLELTPENWYAEFGEDGKVETPIGEVKMGGNQYEKIIEEGREEEWGMIKPTLTNPDVIVEEPSSAKEGQATERPSSYVFIKTFNRDGKKIKFFTTITINKEGFEIAISSHYKELSKIRRALTAGRLQYTNNALRASVSDPTLLRQPAEAVANVGTSTDKSRENNPNAQEKSEQSSQPDEAQEAIIAEATDQINADRDANRPTFDQLLDEVYAAEQPAGGARFQAVPSTDAQPSLSSLEPLEPADPQNYDFDVFGITEANAREMRRIKTEAQASGTFMKAPNGEPTKLNERQWLQVRTAAFKKWFGDWEKATRIEKLRESKPIEISGEEYKGKYELNRNSAKTYIKDNLRGNYTNNDTGERIELSRVGMDKVTSHGEHNDAHLKSIVAIPKLIENSIFIEELSNEKGNDKYDSYHYYVAGMKIGGEDYTAKVVIGVKNGNKYYDHELTSIEKTKLIDDLNLIAKQVVNQPVANSKNLIDATQLSNSLDINKAGKSVYKDKRLFSILQNNSSKVVDENGEPLVVYHETNKTFTTFSRDKAKDGFYFSTRDVSNSLIGKIIGSKGIGVFLNLSNPLIIDKKSGIKNRSYVSSQKGYSKFLRPNNDGVIGFSNYLYDKDNIRNGISSQSSLSLEIVAFNSNQIKSATANNGNFDNESDDIRFQFIGERGAANLEAVNEQFNNELQTLTPENASSKIFNLGNPSEKLRAAGIPNNPFNLYGNKLLKKAQKHGFVVSDIKDLPKAMANPIAVFQGNHKDSFVILTELDINGNKVVASIETNKKGEVDINLISSVYGKSNKGIVDWINGGKAKWIDKEKTLSYLSAPALNTGATNNTRYTELSLNHLRIPAPIAGAQNNSELNSATNVIQNFQNPKLPGEKSHTSDRTFTPITRRQAEALVGLLKKSGLAKEVVFGQEALAKVVEESKEARMLRTPDGEVYGAVKDGTVYLDDAKLNANTPIHEFGHLWNDAVKNGNPELWAKIVELVKDTPYYKDLLENPAYASLNDDARADEAFAQAMGDEGERIFSDPNAPKSIKERFKQLLKDFWAWLGRKLGLRDLSPEQISRLTFERAVKGAVADITRGKPITFKNLVEEVAKPKQKSLSLHDVINEKGEINYEHLRRISQALGRGAYRIYAFPEEVVGRRSTWSRRNDEASLILGASQGASAAEQQALLEQYFEHEGLLYDLGDYIDKNQDRFLNDALNNAEAVVFLSEDGKTVEKFINYRINSDTPFEFMANRIELHNILFPGTKYEVTGVAKFNGQFFFKVSQPFIEGVATDNRSEFYDHMEGRGWKEDEDTLDTFNKGPLKVSDLHEENVLKGADGNFYFIDTVPEHKDKSLEFKIVPNTKENATFARIMEQKRNHILELFNNAKDKNIEARPIPIGKLTEEGKKYLSDISGLDFREFTDFVLNTSDLRHIYKDHYGENEKDKGNNIPLTDNDIKQIIDVIVSPDIVSFLGYDQKKGANKFEFLKENESGTYNLIEVYGEKGGKLTAKTFFNKKRVATNEVLKSQGLPPLYARNVSGASPSGKVPHLIDIKSETISNSKDTNSSGDNQTNPQNPAFAPSEQNLTIAQMLEGTTPIETPKHSFKNFDEARKWAKENIVGTYRNDNTGEDISVSRTAIDKYLSKKAVKKSVNIDTHLSALKILPELIETSVLKETHPDKGENINIKEIQRLYGAINYEGQILPVKITVKVIKSEGNKAYSYEVMEIENPGEQLSHPGNSPVGDIGDLTPKSADILPQSTGFSTSKGTNISETAKENSQNPGARFQITPPAPVLSKQEQNILNKKGYNWFDEFARGTIYIKALQDKVKKLKGKTDEATDDITKNTDIDGAMNLSFGRITSKAQNFEKKEIKTLIETAKAIIKKVGTNWKWSKGSPIKPGKDISPYEAFGLYLRAADMVEAKKLKLPERGENGFIEATGITPDEFIKQYEGQLTGKEIFDLWQNVKSATSFGLKEMLDTGRIEQADFDEYMKRGRYVPQREWEERDVNDDLHDYLEKEKKGTRYNPVIKRAKGRDSLSADPLAHIQSMGMSAIIYAEKNRYKRTAYNLVSQNIELGKKYGLFDLQKVYYTNSGEKDAEGNIIWNETAVRPDQSLFDADKVTRGKIMALKAKIKRDKLKGRDKTSDADKLRTLYEQLNVKTSISSLAEARRTTDEKQQHKVHVFVDGQEYILTFKDMKVANAINQANNNQYNNWLSENMRRYNRFIASMNTAYDIDFGGANLIRDLPFAFFTNLIDKGVAYTGRFMKNMFDPRMHRALALYMRDPVKYADKNNEYAQYVRDYFADGAATGYAFLKEIRQIKQDIKRKIAPTALQKTGNVSEWPFELIFKKIFRSMNEYGETMTRLATYIAARQSGKTHHEAAKDAKNVTVNFNYNSKYTKNLGILQPFANPTIQGGYRVYELTKKNPKKMIGLFAGFIVAGFLNTIFTPPGDDDDEDKKWNDYDRMNNIIWGNTKIPLPHGLRQFWGLGVQIAMATRKEFNKSWKDATLDVLQHAAGEWIPDQINPFNKLKYNKKSDTWEIDGYGIATTLPTIFRPAIDLVANRDYAGRNIYREPFFNADRIPQTFKGLPHVNSFSQNLTNWWFKKGGGDLHYKDINSDEDYKDVSAWYDLNPSSIEYLTKTMLGGTGKFFVNMYNTVENALKGEIDPTTTPIVRRFTKPYDNDLTVMREYYNLIDKADDYMYSLNERRKAVLNDHYPPATQKYMNRATNPQYQQYLIVNAFKDIIKKIESISHQLQVADDEKKKELNTIRIDLMRQAKEKSNKVKNAISAN